MLTIKSTYVSLGNLLTFHVKYQTPNGIGESFAVADDRDAMLITKLKPSDKTKNL